MLLLVIIAFLSSPDSAEFQSGAEGNANPCSIPLTYRFGQIDPRFEIEKGELATIMSKVENIWSSPLNTDILHYDPDGDITINFVYSDVQKLTKNERIYSERIDNQREQLKTAKENFQNLKESFDRKLESYNKTLSQYREAVETYNEAVKGWEDRGELSNKEKTRLENVRSRIDDLERKKNQQYREVEALRKRVNYKGNRLNTLAAQENKLIENYNERFSGHKKFNQGHYIRRGNQEKINVYQFNDFEDLKVVLVHEFGHALGLKHGNDAQSMMYYLMNPQNQKEPKLSKEDIRAIKHRCF